MLLVDPQNVDLLLTALGKYPRGVVSNQLREETGLSLYIIRTTSRHLKNVRISHAR